MRASPVKLIASQLERLLVFVFLLIFAGVFWPPDGYLTPHGGKKGASNVFDAAAFSILAVFLLIVFFTHRREVLRLSRCAWPVLALTGLAFLSAFWSDDPLLVLRRSGTVALTTLFGVYLVVRSDMAECVALLVKVYAVAMLASLAVIVVAPSVAIGGNETYVYAWRGAFSDKNTLGLACALTIIFSVYAFRNRFGPRWLAVLAIVASLILLKLSESKTPVVVMVVVLYAAIFANFLRRRNGVGLAVGFTLGIVGLGGAALIILFMQDVLALLGRDPTFTNRAKIWHYSISYISHRPWLGYGYGAFWRLDSVEANQVWAMIEFQTPHAHNAWLELGLGIGIVGMGLIALNWLVGFYRVARLLTAPTAGHVAFCLALLTGIFMENLTEYEFFRQGNILWVLFVTAFVYLGRVAQSARIARRESQPRGRPPALPAGVTLADRLARAGASRQPA